MAYSKLRQAGSSAFAFARVHFAVGGELTDRVSFGVGVAAGKAISRGFSGFAIEADSEGAPVPAWKYWNLKAETEQWKGIVETERAKGIAGTEQRKGIAEIERWKGIAETEREFKEHWRWICDASAKEYLASIKDARLEILQFKYQLKAIGIPEIFIRSLTREADLHCHKKAKDEHLPEEDRKFYEDFAINWFPQARKKIWRIIFEMPTMIGFKEDMQKVLSSHDLDLLVMKATTFHKEFHHFHHSGVKQREIVTFVREHIRQGIHDRTVDPVHLEGFMQAMAKKINVNALFVDEMEMSEGADE